MNNNVDTKILTTTPILEAVDLLAQTTEKVITPYTLTVVRLIALSEGLDPSELDVGRFLPATAREKDAIMNGLRARDADTQASPKTVRNYVGSLRSFRAAVAEKVGQRSLEPMGRLRQRPRFVKAESTRKQKVHPSVKKAIETLEKYRGEDLQLIFGEGERTEAVAFHAWSQSTRRRIIGALWQYARIAAAQSGGRPVPLEELIQPATFPRIQDWYRDSGELARETSSDRPGTKVFSGRTTQYHMVGALRALIGLYVRRCLPELYEDLVRNRVLESFSAISISLNEGIKRREPELKPDVSEITPHDFAVFHNMFFDSYSLKARGRGVNEQRSGDKHRRACMALVILPEAPIRMRNLVELRVGTQIVNRDGVWHIHIPAVQLKNRGAGKPGVPYKRRLSPQASQVISTYIAKVEAAYGNDFFKMHPLFGAPPKPGAKRGSNGPTPRSARLGEDIRDLFFSVHGVRFTPHRIRDVVATYLISWGPENGHDGLALAAAALGDTIAMVVKRYYQPPDRGLDEYTESLFK